MTVSTTTRRAGPFLGNDSTTVFPFTFKVFEDVDVLVFVTEANVTTELENGVDFIATLNSDQNAAPGGYVTIAGDPPALDTTLDIVGSVGNTQGLSLPQGGNFNAGAIEDALDRATMQIIQLDDAITQGVIPGGVSLSGLPDAATRASKMLGFDSDGNPVAVAPVSGSATELAIDIADTTDAAKNAGQVGYKPSLNYVAGTVGAALRDGLVNVMWFVTSEVDRAAIKAYTSTTDHTTLINAALAYGKRVYLPAGLWNVDSDTGVVLAEGYSIVGDGLMRTIIKAAATGGSAANLVNYVKGSVIKRAFTAGVANDYVTGCYLADFSIQLNHPAYNAANYRQIGVDLRNITRSVVERVHVGTLGIPGQEVCPTPSGTDRVQGYGIVCGTRSSGNTDYCGGEANTIRDCFVWGAYRGLTIDDDILSPLSGAHATLVDNCDFQFAHELCVQKLQYAAGVIFRNLTIQSIARQSGNADPTRGTQMSGYCGAVHIKYAEAGSACDKLHEFLVGSQACTFTADYYSSTAGTASILDSAPGSKNRMTYRAAVARSGLGQLVDTYSGAPLEATYKGHFVGATETVTASNGLTMIRNGTGDYTMRLTTAQPNANWVADVFIDTNASGHGAMVTFQYSTQSTTDLRFFTYGQNAGVTTGLDPRMMLVRVRQVA